MTPAAPTPALPDGSAPDATAALGARGAGMRFIMIVVLIDMLSIGLIIPVLPALVGSFTSSPAEQVFWFGVVTFTFGFANFVTSPLLGALSDRYGRRPVLLLGFCGLALNFFFTALATQLWMLIAVRLVGGAMQANAAVANAYVADITAPEQRAKRFGLLGAMFGIGFMLGPVVGGTLGAIHIQLPFFVAGTLSLVNLAYGWFVLPESLAPAARRAVTWRSVNPFASFRDLGALKGVGVLVGVIACAGLAQFVLYITWVLYGHFRFGWGPRESGLSLFAIGVMSVFVQGWLLGKLLERFTAQRLAVVGLASSTLAHFGWGLATEGWMMYAIIFANVFGFTAAAALQSIVSSAADRTRQGQTLGAVSSLNSLMAVIAPAVATPLMGMVSHLPPSDWRMGAPMYFCALLLAAALGLALIHFRAQRRLRLATVPTAAPPAAPAAGPTF